MNHKPITDGRQPCTNLINKEFILHFKKNPGAYFPHSYYLLVNNGVDDIVVVNSVGVNENVNNAEDVQQLDILCHVIDQFL